LNISANPEIVSAGNGDHGTRAVDAAGPYKNDVLTSPRMPVASRRSVLTSRIKLRHVQCFLGVMQFGSLQKAAAALSISQPAASKTMSELEACLGLSLFERGRNGAVPTPAAITFQRYAASCLGSLEDGVIATMAQEVRAVGRIRLGILPSLVGQWFSEAVGTFQAHWEGVSLQIATGGNAALLQGLREASFDVAVGRISEPATMSGLTFEYLLGEPLAICVRAHHPLLLGSACTGSDLGRYPLILPPAGTLIRESANRILANVGIARALPSVETISVSVGRQLTRDHDFVWMVPEGAIRSDVAAGILQPLPLSTAGSDEPIGVLLPVDVTLTPALRGLLSTLRDASKGANPPIR
jgi:LysR family pca operon transcriptional activator